jgi:hypothetical protein
MGKCVSLSYLKYSSKLMNPRTWSRYPWFIVSWLEVWVLVLATVIWSGGQWVDLDLWNVRLSPCRQYQTELNYRVPSWYLLPWHCLHGVWGAHTPLLSEAFCTILSERIHKEKSTLVFLNIATHTCMYTLMYRTVMHICVYDYIFNSHWNQITIVRVYISEECKILEENGGFLFL